MDKLIVFDWNGTLLADVQACLAADNQVLKKFGGRPVDLKTYRDTIIIPAIDFYVQHGCNRRRIITQAKTVSKTFHRFYETKAAHSRMRPGARSILQWLQRHFYQTIILSNHTVVGIQQQLNRLHIDGYFSDILANTVLGSSLQGRNKLEKLKAYLKERHYSHKDILIIGDSPEEIEIGKTLHITSVAVCNGYISTPRLKAVQPNYLIQSLFQLKKILHES